jgi:hypothetical protein
MWTIRGPRLGQEAVERGPGVLQPLMVGVKVALGCGEVSVTGDHRIDDVGGEQFAGAEVRPGSPKVSAGGVARIRASR